MLRAKQRLQADSFDKKYVNLVGGPLGCDDLAQVSREMHMAGLGDAFSIVPGPFMRATHGKALGLTHMPLQPSSTYDMLHECLPRAYELANAENKFIHFVREHQERGTYKYREQLRSNSQRGKYFLRVDMADLLAFDDQLSSQLRNSPTDYLKRFESAVEIIYENDLYDEQDPNLEPNPKF